jgi:hypothetical protein
MIYAMGQEIWDAAIYAIGQEIWNGAIYINGARYKQWGMRYGWVRTCNGE